jgi:hypothetical protein
MTGLSQVRTRSQSGVRLVRRYRSADRPTVSVERLHMRSCLDRLCGLPVPRQQFIESIDRVSIDHALEHIVQISVGFDVVHLAGFNERTQRRPSCSAVVRAGAIVPSF